MNIVKLSSLGTLRNGMNYSKSYSKKGCKIIGVADFGDRVFPEYDTLSEIDSSIVKEEDLLRDGDILFVRSNGNKNLVGRSLYISCVKEPVCYSGFCILFRPNSNIVCPEYLFYVLRSPFCKKQYSYSQQTNITNLSQGVLGSVNVPLPSMGTQKKLAKVFSLLDKKILLNNQINAELEALAKTIYDYWFLQFEFPNEEGLPYKSSGGKMVWSEELKREIPEGWGVKYLNQISSISAGGDKPSNVQKNPDSVCAIPVYSNGSENLGLYGFTKTAKITEPSITVSARGSIGYSLIRMNPYTPIIRLISVIPNYEDYLKYIEITLNNIPYSKNGSIQQQLTVPQISEYKILTPSKDIMSRYHEITMHGQNMIERLRKENLELAALRDWLLPMLMNGQVGFNRAEV